MADEPEAERLDEDEGGPIKSFLEHLEDLRWVLIKSAAAAGTAMLICLLAGNYLVAFLEWPLESPFIAKFHPSGVHSVRLTLYTNQIATFDVRQNDLIAPLIGTNQNVRLELSPIQQGTNLLVGLTVRPDTDHKARLPIQIVNLSPAGSFIVATKVAFYGGLVVSAPFILYFISQFVFPALRLKEKKYIFLGLLIGGGLFFIGVTFCYFVLMPVALAASMEYANWLGFAAYQWRAEDYISFVCKFMLGMGLGFEMPVVVLTLVKIGILSYRTLVSARRYVIVICFLLGAILTTPEVVTQVLMAIPLLFLYEVSVWIAWYWEHEDRAQARRKLLLALIAIIALVGGLWATYKFWGPAIRNLLH